MFLFTGRLMLCQHYVSGQRCFARSVSVDVQGSFEALLHMRIHTLGILRLA